MLQGRLIVALVAAAVLTTACSGSDDGAVRDNVVEPGITAIDQASGLACANEADVLRAALESFELLEGAPAESEGALVAAGYLREESDLFDVVDGQLAAATSECKGVVPVTAPSGSAPLTAPATEVGQIVTDEQLVTAAELLAAMTADEIAEFGGKACARELADVFAAAERFIAREGSEPSSLDDLAGDLAAPVDLWELDPSGAYLVPAAGSPCPDVFSDTAGE